MGESLTRQDISPGDGVYKSTDGGATLDAGRARRRPVTSRRSASIPRIPTSSMWRRLGDIFGNNPERGVYRTKDGGKTWQQVLFKSEQAGAFDLVDGSDQPERALRVAQPAAAAAVGPRRAAGRTAACTRRPMAATRGPTSLAIPGMPKGVVGRIGVAVSPVRPSRVWAMVEADEGAAVTDPTTAGKTWQRHHERQSVAVGASSYMHVIADTRMPDTVWLSSRMSSANRRTAARRSLDPDAARRSSCARGSIRRTPSG